MKKLKDNVGLVALLFAGAIWLMWALVIAEPTMAVSELRSRLKGDPATIKGAFVCRSDCNLHVLLDTRRYCVVLPTAALRDKLSEDLYYAGITVDYSD